MPHFARSDQEVCAASISWETFVSLGEFVVCVLLRFEEDFVSQHGHAPKGADRAPLASTYVQYREWKRNIRDHAAIQIQAFYRGSALRGKLHDVQQKLSGEESNSENKLSAVNHRRVGPCRVSSASLRLSLSRPGRRAPDLSTIVLPHCAAGDVDDGADLSGRDVASLIHEKKMVKAQLKAFDARFFADHGRMVRPACSPPPPSLPSTHWCAARGVRHRSLPRARKSQYGSSTSSTTS